MPKYHFLGAHSAITGPDYAHTLTKFGECLELPEAAATNHAVHGCRLLPASEFEAIGFTTEELEMNSDLFAHDDTADEPFLEKRAVAFSAADKFRASAVEAARTQE